ETIIFQYLFAIFNSLQGFFIFLFHCLVSPQVRDAIRGRWTRYQSRRATQSSLIKSTKSQSSSSENRGHSISEINTRFKNSTMDDSSYTNNNAEAQAKALEDKLNEGPGSVPNGNRPEPE
ncbi:unnamed protein product, partial [Owenia fusiformis]